MPSPDRHDRAAHEREQQVDQRRLHLGTPFVAADILARVSGEHFRNRPRADRRARTAGSDILSFAAADSFLRVSTETILPLRLAEIFAQTSGGYTIPSLAALIFARVSGEYFRCFATADIFALCSSLNGPRNLPFVEADCLALDSKERTLPVMAIRSFSRASGVQVPFSPPGVIL
jgi:hypothetical protein